MKMEAVMLISLYGTPMAIRLKPNALKIT